MKAKSIQNKPKILVILGPTATGKSELAVKLAQKFNGEVISADSRQVYTGLDIGTGKITKKEMRGVPHYMLDIVSPNSINSFQKFSVERWKKETEKNIIDIISRGKLPIICGGTGFYIQSIVDNVSWPEVPANLSLRKKLQKKSTEELFKILEKLDGSRAKNIAKEQGSKNPVRLIRAIEIARALGKVPKINKNKNSYQFLQIGLNLPTEDLKKKIHLRMLARLKKGMVKEAENLYKKGLSWKRMREFGLEYRFLAEFLQNKINKKELGNLIEKGNLDYAKRQMTWFKRDERILWFNPDNFNKIKKEVDSFIDK